MSSSCVQRTLILVGVMVVSMGVGGPKVTGDVYSESGTSKETAGLDAKVQQALDGSTADQLRKLAAALLAPPAPYQFEPPPMFQGVFIANGTDVDISVRLAGWEIDSDKDRRINMVSELEEKPRAFVHKSAIVEQNSSCYFVDVRPAKLPNGEPDLNKGGFFYGIGKLQAYVRLLDGTEEAAVTVEATHYDRLIVDGYVRRFKRGIYTKDQAWPTLVLEGQDGAYTARWIAWTFSQQAGDDPVLEQQPEPPVSFP